MGAKTKWVPKLMGAQKLGVDRVFLLVEENKRVSRH
jgi:hypothetical protein